MLETFLLITAAKAISAKRLFEIGTFLGNTTLNLALNTSDDARIFTLDLDRSSAQPLTQNSFDAPLTAIHLSQESSLDFSSSPVARKIRTLCGSSLTFDFSEWQSSIDLVFIDGGHDRASLLSDTENALHMARRDRTSCIFWHDYGNSEYPELTACLDELSQELEMFHIGDTMLCVNFQGPHDPLRRHLLKCDPA